MANIKLYSVGTVLAAIVGGVAAYTAYFNLKHPLSKTDDGTHTDKETHTDEIPLDKLPDDLLPFQRALAKEAGNPNFLDVNDYLLLARKLGIATDDRGQPGFGWVNSFYRLKGYIDDGSLHSTVENNFPAFENALEALYFIQLLAGDPNALENVDRLALAGFFGEQAQSLVDKSRRAYETLLSHLERVSNESSKFRGDHRLESMIATAKQLPPAAFQEFNAAFGLSIALPQLPIGIVRVTDAVSLQ